MNKNFIKVVISSIGGFVIAGAYSQEIPKPEIGPSDKHDYVCKVNSINADFDARSLYGRDMNFWTKTMSGGKFVALNMTEIRVASSSKEKAATEVFEFYQQNSAKVRGTFNDKGQQPFAKVVFGCSDDPRSTREVKLPSLPLENYRLLLKDKEHLYMFLALTKDKFSDEQLVKLENPNVQVPADGFDRQEFFQKNGARIRQEVAHTKLGPFILEGQRSFAPYSFEKGGFDLGDVGKKSAEYVYEHGQSPTVKLPRYNLSASPKFSFYKPASTDEAKKLEHSRAGSDAFVWRTYVQPVSAKLLDKNPEINGVISAVEVRNKKGETVMRISAL